MVPDLGEATVRPVPVWTVTVTSRASSNRLFAAVIEPEAVENRNDWGMAGRTSRNPHPTPAANAMTTNNATTDMANG